MEQQAWLMLSFTLPKEPSRARVSVWRKLKKTGAVNLGQSVWILPQSDRHLAVLTEIYQEIVSNHGDSYILEASIVHTAQNIITVFHKASDEEYKEFLGKCKDFFREIEKESAIENFSFAEIEENETEYRKLDGWLTKILARDFFGAPLQTSSVEALADCRRLLTEYSEKVYRLNT